MYIDPWQWFRDFQWQVIMEGNTSKLQLPQQYQRGWQYLEASQYRVAIDAFQQGAVLARQMELPMWEFFFESWVGEVNVLASNYTEALKTTTRLVAKSVQPDYKDHPCRAVVYFTLAWVYFYVDVHGYERDILQALDTLDSDLLLDEETHHRSIFLRAEIAFEKDQHDVARATNARYMNWVEGNAFRQASGYGLERAIAYAEGDLPLALQSVQLREHASRSAKLLNNASDSVLWQGVLQQYLGEPARALATIQRGMSEYDMLNLPKQSSYYHILAEYYTAIGDYAQAMRYRDQQLPLAQQSGSLSNEFHCRLDRCYLLNRMGQDATDDLASAENCAKQSKQPAFFLSKLQSAISVQTTRYRWQETFNS